MTTEFTKEKFIELLESTKCSLLQQIKNSPFGSSPKFENAVRETISNNIEKLGINIKVDFNSHAQAFPDICLGHFGVEVKYTEKNTWRGVANSVSQGMLDQGVTDIYVIWCKEGGVSPAVRYRPYEEVVMHVRTSHVPRFEIDMEAETSLFKRFKTTYAEFTTFSMQEKMDLVRSYARKRISLGSNIFFWFLESQIVDPSGKRTLRLFRELSPDKKQRLALEEIFLWTDEFLENPGGNNAFDTRVNYFQNMHRVVYPEHLALYEAISSIGDAGFSGKDFLESLGYSKHGEEVFRSIKRNSYRIYAQWWDGIDCLSLEVWLKYVQGKEGMG